jgi:hypothetical protein
MYNLYACLLHIDKNRVINPVLQCLYTYNQDGGDCNQFLDLKGEH